MTNIYTYCLFDHEDNFEGVYSSLKAVYRDALKLANEGYKEVKMLTGDGWQPPSLKDLRNTLKGSVDVVVLFRSDQAGSKILKTKLRE
tara:strand:+ start:270 stop:533 length:264 start_codon:yes stop_codon:yes gene_type:complete